MRLHASDSLVFTRFQSDLATEKWEGEDLFSPPCIEIWTDISLPCAIACSTPDDSVVNIILAEILICCCSNEFCNE